MNPITTHFYKSWKIEIYRNESGNFGYHCYRENSKDSRNEGYDNTQDAVEAAQNYINEQTETTNTLHPTKEVGSPTGDEVTPGEDLNDL